MPKIITLVGDNSFTLEVVGESFYQDNLVAIRGPLGQYENEYHQDQNGRYTLPNRRLEVPTYDALLIPDPTNQHDYLELLQAKCPQCGRTVNRARARIQTPSPKSGYDLGEAGRG